MEFSSAYASDSEYKKRHRAAARNKICAWARVGGKTLPSLPTPPPASLKNWLLGRKEKSNLDKGPPPRSEWFQNYKKKWIYQSLSLEKFQTPRGHVRSFSKLWIPGFGVWKLRNFSTLIHINRDEFRIEKKWENYFSWKRSRESSGEFRRWNRKNLRLDRWGLFGGSQGDLRQNFQKFTTLNSHSYSNNCKSNIHVHNFGKKFNMVDN